MLNRCNKLLEMARADGIDAVLITSQINRRYFSGFTGSNAIILITPDRRMLLTDFRYTIQAKAQSKGVFEVIEVNRAIDTRLLADELKRIGAKTIGFENETMTVSLYERFVKELGSGLEFKPVSAIMSNIRIYKDADEIANIIAAQNASDAAFADLVKRIKGGMKETDVATELEYLMKKHGSECCSFDTIVGSGENGALCHAIPGERRLQNGDLVVLDFGSKVNGYCSDMTRTIAMGRPCDKLIQIYDIVREAQQRALNALKPGITGKELDAVARDYIASKGYGECFGHSLGHGFGLEVHEAPNASTVSTYTLEPGMTITVEPGIYIEGLGGVRIEDCCIMTEDGYINPVTSPKELIIIE